MTYLMCVDILCGENTTVAFYHLVEHDGEGTLTQHKKICSAPRKLSRRFGLGDLELYPQNSFPPIGAARR